MYRDPTFLRSHIRSIVAFYHPTVVDREVGGYFNGLKDDGKVYDRTTRHLVSTCRHIYNYAVASALFDDDDLRQAARHGLAFLQDHHRQPDGGYAWILDGRSVADGTRHCYGHAFVLLAVATAAQAGLAEADPVISLVFDLLEARFFEPAALLYRDVIAADDWDAIDPYRGQNANMHLCEAMLAAHAATGAPRYLERAYAIAQRICVDLAAATDGLIWEHYGPDWSIDWDYNRDDPKNLFRPYGYLPGHFVEWAKLLVLLHRERPEPWLLERARHLYDVAVERAWDAERGGFNYTFGPDGAILDTDRYYWVVAEAIAAAAQLAATTDDGSYWDWYDTCWEYPDRTLVDHTYGGWYRVVDADGQRYDDLKSPPAKTDYHPLSACVVALDALGAVERPTRRQ